MKDDHENPTLLEPARFVKGVGPRRAELLASLGVQTVGDLLNRPPRGYLDTGAVTPISKITPGEICKVCGTVAGISSRMPHRGRIRSIVKIDVRDRTGAISAVWFNAPYRSESVRRGETVTLTGKANFYDGLQMVSPAIEVIDQAEAESYHEWDRSILPLYPLKPGLSQRTMRLIMDNALAKAKGSIVDHFDAGFLKARELPSLGEAYVALHRPRSLEQAQAGRQRLAYDELFFMQMALALRRRAVKKEYKTFVPQITPKIDAHIRARFPFVLTPDQEKVIAEIAADIRGISPMNRLLQGDVGSGKTVVALYAMLVYVANHWQAAMMAPTEILAEQHYNTIMRFLKGSRVRAALLKGGQRRAERAQIINEIAAGQIDIVVGTHAIIQKKVEFARLGIVVVDEQHKFGVLQRGELKEKGANPDFLVMTATPIPRTLAMTVFGDLDVSLIKHMPPGRRPPATSLVSDDRLLKAYDFIRREIAAGRQAYFVYPLIEESEKEGMANLKAATETHEHLSREVFPDLKVALLHGEMSGRQKEEVMRDFRAGKTNVLVATVVIEVGIDVPNATVMVIENAERFGLSQLHQLRGRIGRGGEKSYCILVGEKKSEIAAKRLDIMTRTTDGFRIAEEDLRIRGPGELFGTRQHGLPDLVHADLVEDWALMSRAREDAFALVEGRAPAGEAHFIRLLKIMRKRFASKISLAEIA